MYYSIIFYYKGKAMENLCIHEEYMKQCLELAKIAEGFVSPNPLVGAVVLDKDGNIAGKGYHEKYGEAHAEINALDEAGYRAENGTIYINLEPCSHYGKTPPCIDRIIREKIKTIVVGMTDPNPIVAGNGIKKAREAGIEVIENILENQSIKLNEIFIKNQTQNKPFVALKTAQTLDGKVATHTGSSKWITSEAAREEVHRLRNKYDAILTGSATVIKDNPQLNCRKSDGRNPIRVILDSSLKTPTDSNVYKDDGTKTIIAALENADSEKFKFYPDYVDIIKCPANSTGKINLDFLAQRLHELKIFSILVEAGGILNGAFLESKLVDKIYFFTAPKLLGDSSAKSSFEGLNIENINDSHMLKFGDIKCFPPDIMIEGYIK